MIGQRVFQDYHDPERPPDVTVIDQVIDGGLQIRYLPVCCLNRRQFERVGRPLRPLS